MSKPKNKGPKPLGKPTNQQPAVTPIDPYRNFVAAEGFLGACLLLQTATPLNPSHLVFPSCVMQAFALELYLKCILRLERKEPGYKHELKSQLFDILDDHTKQKLSKYYEEEIAQSPLFAAAVALAECPSSYDIESVLARSDNAFVLLRYWYEKTSSGLWTRVNGVAGATGMHEVISATRRLIVEDLRPDWKLTIKRPIIITYPQWPGRPDPPVMGVAQPHP